MNTCRGVPISDTMFANKLAVYINQFYKILPIKEAGEPTLQRYMLGLQREMLGCRELIHALKDDPQYLTLLSILQFMIDNDCDVATVKSDVFRSINILKHMQARFKPEEGGDTDGRVGKV